MNKEQLIELITSFIRTNEQYLQYPNLQEFIEGKIEAYETILQYLK